MCRYHSALDKRRDRRTCGSPWPPATAGLGITMSFESHVREAIERRELVSILETFCAPFPGYFLYYPQRRQASRVLRALY